MIILQQHRVALHQTRLVEVVNPFNPQFQNAYERLSGGFEGLGYAAGQAKSLAMVEMSRVVAQQASFLSALDGFYFLIGVALIGGVIAF